MGYLSGAFDGLQRQWQVSSFLLLFWHRLFLLVQPMEVVEPNLNIFITPFTQLERTVQWEKVKQAENQCINSGCTAVTFPVFAGALMQEGWQLNCVD